MKYRYIGQAFTPEETLRAYTIWSAYASKQEHLTGTIEKGKWGRLDLYGYRCFKYW